MASVNEEITAEKAISSFTAIVSTLIDLDTEEVSVQQLCECKDKARVAWHATFEKGSKWLADSWPAADLFRTALNDVIFATQKKILSLRLPPNDQTRVNQCLEILVEIQAFLFVLAVGDKQAQDFLNHVTIGLGQD